MKNQSNATIGKLAAQALNRMRSAGINEGGRALFGSFAEAKRLTQNFAAMVRSDVTLFGYPKEVTEPFASIIGCAISLTFRGWADLTAWLKAVEALLKELEQRQYIAEAIPEPRPVSALTMFNGPAKPTPKPYTEATDPETGHTYRVDSHGRILVRQAGGHSFYAGNCNVYVVKAVIRLGLISDDRES